VDRAITELEQYIFRLCDAARAHGYEVLFFGDYAITTVEEGAVFPNGALRNAGLFLTQDVKGMAYPDFFSSKAFAMVDHELAHVYVPDRGSLERAREVVSDIRGVAEVLDREAQQAWGIAHPNSGDLVMVAEDGYWFAYPWWGDKAEAPDFASHVDIHNKPGFDPCELFFGWPPGSVSMDTTKVGGSHGRIGPGREVAWATTCSLGANPVNLIELSQAVSSWLNDHPNT
jgi:predicted AlkP superfamily pyrophosphatase or phosphodiesterase